MKNLNRTKAIVLGLGVLTVVASLYGAVSTMNLLNYSFPLYAGMTLVGTTLLHKENTINSRA